MTYRFRTLICISAASVAVSVAAIAYLILPAIELAMTFLRETPIAAELAVVAPIFSVVLFLVIDALKPVYRHSYRTHGLSLTAR